MTAFVDKHESIKCLLNTNTRIYIVATGAGAGLQNMLWGISGCSSFLVGAEFPYSPEATDRFLGFKPSQYCSQETAIDLAMEAYMRAYKYGSEAQIIGLGITASVASLREHRGDHRIHIAMVSKGTVWAHECVLEKGSGDGARKRDGDVVDQIGLRFLLWATGIDLIPLPATHDVTEQARKQFLARGFFAANGQRLRIQEIVNKPHLIFPGAFNPPHQGHFEIAAEFKEPVTFAITVDHPHKPALTLVDMLERAALLYGHERMFTEGDNLYIDKAYLFPFSSFIIGADALKRMLDPAWGVEIEPMLEEFQNLETEFWVVGRVIDGVFVSYSDIIKLIPERFRASFRELPGRWDLSSSGIRNI